MTSKIRTIAELEKRFKRLEIQNRWMKLTGVLLLVVFSLTTCHLRSQDIIEAQRLVLRDAKGKIRSELKTDAKGNPEIVFFGADGSMRAELSVFENEFPMLRLQGREGSSESIMLSVDDLGPRLSMIGGGGPEDRGQGDIQLSITKGYPHAYVSGTDYSIDLSAGQVSITGGERQARLSSRNLEIADESHKVRAVLGSTAIAYPPTGKVRDRPASSLVLFDEAGRVIWRAPTN